jgi:hypothetical protein
LIQIKLNALAWTGIAVSVIWFNLFVGYSLYHRAQSPNRYFMEATRSCDNVLQSSDDIAILLERKEDRISHQAENRAKWKKCRDDINERYRRRLDNIYKRIPFIAAAGLGTITFGWLIAWCGIVVSRRIRRRSK